MNKNDYFNVAVYEWQSKICWDRFRKHWMTWTKIYQVWQNMKKRCDNPIVHNYNRYWGRWIKYCHTWKLFINFYNDMRDWYQDWLTLDRRENDWWYSKENCRWITMAKQNRNRRSNIIYKWKCITDWANELWLNPKIVHWRIRRDKWSIEKALELI